MGLLIYNHRYQKNDFAPCLSMFLESTTAEGCHAGWWHWGVLDAVRDEWDVCE